MREDDESGEEDDDDDENGAQGETSEGDDVDDEEVVEDDEEIDEEADPELRRKIEEALRVNGIQPATGETDDESEEEFMDDDQMMAIDEQLAAVFKARADERRLGKGSLLFLVKDIILSFVSCKYRFRCRRSARGHALQESRAGSA